MYLISIVNFHKMYSVLYCVTYYTYYSSKIVMLVFMQSCSEEFRFLMERMLSKLKIR